PPRLCDPPAGTPRQPGPGGDTPAPSPRASPETTFARPAVESSTGSPAPQHRLRRAYPRPSAATLLSGAPGLFHPHRAEEATAPMMWLRRLVGGGRRTGPGRRPTPSTPSPDEGGLLERLRQQFQRSPDVK